MTLLVLIALSMLTLSTITIRENSLTSAKAEAQANARVAMMLAIGELQKQMGPDQRVSMTANQRPKSGTDGVESSAVLGNLHWTGVYNAWLSTVTDRPTPEFRSWLISGDPSLVSLAAFPDSALSAGSFIELVGSGTAGSVDSAKVRVPAMEFVNSSNQRGRMAWWVGDQGVKAALGTRSPSTDTSLGVIRNNLQSAPRNAIEIAAYGNTKPFADLAPDDPRISQITSWQQSAHLVSDIESPRPLFHDLAAFSSGLMTNVRAGGFRKDLSMKLETYTDAPDLSDPNNVLYTVRSQMTGNDEVGINFQELWAYYHLYKELNYNGGLTYTTGGTVSNDTPFLQTANSLQGLTEDDWDRFKHPATISYQTVLSFEVGPAPRDPGKQALYVNMDPVVTIWNPLDVAIDIPTHKDHRDRDKCYIYVFWVIPYDINVGINDQALRKCSLMRSVYRWDAEKVQEYINAGRQNRISIDFNMMRLNVGEKERLTLKPGEVLKVSQTGNTATSNGGYTGLDGTKGFNYGGGTRFPLIDEKGAYLLVDNSDQITYSAAPNNLTAGRDGASGGNLIDGFGRGNSRRWSLTHNSIVIGSPWGTNIHMGMVGIDHCYGYSRVQVGETRDYRNPWMNKTLSNSERVFANDPQYADVFPTIEGAQQTRTIPISAITNLKTPFMVHHYSIKTEEENMRGTKSISRYNPTARNVDFYNLSEKERDMMPYDTKMTPLTSWLDAPLDESFDGQGYFGSSMTSSLGSNFVSTHSVPRHPIVSLAAFQNSFANGFNRLRATPLPSPYQREHSMARHPLLPHISHAIGNSLAPSLISPDQTEATLPDNPHPLADHSYLANRALWDDYFLSSIAPQPDSAFAQELDQKSVALKFFQSEKQLPIARYLPNLRGQANELVNSFFSGNTPNETAVRNVASYLRVDGMFNINSASAEAWKAILGSLRTQPIVIRDENGNESIVPNQEDTPVSSIGVPRNIIVSDDSSYDPIQWYGRRTLTDDEIAQLAQAIVIEVRKRGPFLSLADFVNRRVGNHDSLARAGAIQSALDSDDVDINKNQNTSRSVNPTVANRFEFPEAEKGAMHYGAPSIVKQGDILTPIAPVLSARSDSFIVRAYGESLDNDGNVVAQAWCEAVVERNREYLDTTDSAELATSDLTEAVNRSFGRRFTIVSFRWLNGEEV